MDPYSKKAYIFCLLLATGLYFLLVVAVTVYALYIHKTNTPGRRHLDEDYWDYNDQDNWRWDCIRGKNQSPIALSQRTAVKREIEPIEFHYFEKCDCLIVKNTGRAVVLRFKEGCGCELPEINGGDFDEDGAFVFEYLKFHWPAEHTIDNVTYPLEGHFVFYDDNFNDYKSALSGHGGLAILAVVYRGHSLGTHFKALADAVSKISKNPGSSIDIPTQVNLNDFLPRSRSSFFMYSGSLTEPTCREDVKWIVFSTPSNVSLENFEEFSYIFDENGKALYSNRRKLQDLNGRTVTFGKIKH